MEYQQVTKQVIDAVRGDINTVNKWQLAGASVREFFGTETAIREVKAQFIADAIMPAIDKKHVQALAKELPRKGSAEYGVYLTVYGADAWETANQAKKDARSVADTMFSRVVKYAFPVERERSVTDTKTKIVEFINDAIKKAQKDEAPEYDVAALLGHLQAALTVVTK